MHITAAQVFCTDHLTGCRFDQRRATEENRTLIFNDNRFIAHRRHICPAGGTGTHNDCDLRYAFGRHICLIVKNPSEVIAIRKYFILIRQIGTTGIHQINTRQVVLLSNFLRAQMLFNRHRIIRTAFDRRIITDDHTFLPGDTTNTGNHACRWCCILPVFFLIHAVSSQLRKFQKRRSRIEQHLNTVARQ